MEGRELFVQGWLVSTDLKGFFSSPCFSYFACAEYFPSKRMACGLCGNNIFIFMFLFSDKEITILQLINLSFLKCIYCISCTANAVSAGLTLSFNFTLQKRSCNELLLCDDDNDELKQSVTNLV